MYLVITLMTERPKNEIQDYSLNDIKYLYFS